MPGQTLGWAGAGWSSEMGVLNAPVEREKEGQRKTKLAQEGVDVDGY